MKAERASPRAFSLVELLTVLAIVAVLASLVMQASTRAREQSQSAQCASNLRQLAVANLAYAGEHDGSYVPAQDAANRIRWHGIRASAQAPFDPTMGPLAPYLGGEGRIKKCPAFQDFLGKGKTFELGSGGYGYNSAYIGGTPADYFSPTRSARVPQPARVIMFSDAALPRTDGLQEYPFAEPFRWEDAQGKLQGPLSPSVHFRHGGRANVAWCDGHVTSEISNPISGKNFYGGDNKKFGVGWFGPEADNGYWKP